MKHVLSTNVFWLLVVFILIPIVHYLFGFNIDNEFLNYILMFNIVIWLATWFPVKGSDGHRALKLLRGNLEETKAFDALSHMYDSKVDAETVSTEFEGSEDYFSPFVKNIAYMEYHSEEPAEYHKIYEKDMADKLDVQQKVLKGFQLLFKHIDGHELNNKEVELFSEIKSIYEETFSKFHMYFTTGAEKHIEDLKKKEEHFTNHRENRILNRILARM